MGRRHSVIGAVSPMPAPLAIHHYLEDRKQKRNVSLEFQACF